MKKYIKIPLLVLVSLCLISCQKNADNKDSNTDGDEQTSIIDPIVTGDGDGDSSDDDTIPPYTPWEPDIIDYDDPQNPDGVPVDETVYDYSMVTYTNVWGGFVKSGNTYTASSNNSLAISQTPPFTHGTIKADFTYTSACDSGLIFGCSSRTSSYWEGYGTCYYMFFINYQGNTYLAKTDNGDWITIASGRAVGIQSTTEPVTLKCYFYGNKINCFVGDELLISVKDQAYLTGTGYGFRAGTAGVKVSNVVVTNEKI